MALFRRKRNRDASDSNPTMSSDNQSGLPQIDLLLRSRQATEVLFEALVQAGAPEDQFPYTDEVGPDIVSVLSVDHGDRYLDISGQVLEQMGISPQEITAEALERLRQAAPSLSVEGGGGRYRISFPENPDLTASFMLVANSWVPEGMVQGDPVFAAGSRVMLHLCGSDDADALVGLSRIAQTHYQESLEDPVSNGRPLSPKLLTPRDGKLQKFS